MKDAGIEETVDCLIISLNCQSSELGSISLKDNESDDSENKCDGLRMLDF